MDALYKFKRREEEEEMKLSRYDVKLNNLIEHFTKGK